MRVLRILLVEDEYLIAMNAQSILEAEGHQLVGLAPDAKQAFALASAHRPDVALVDLHLRDGLTGPEIGTKLAQHGIPVLFVTANPALAPLGQPSILGVLPKPYMATDLVNALHFLASSTVESWSAAPVGLWLTRLPDPDASAQECASRPPV